MRPCVDVMVGSVAIREQSEMDDNLGDENHQHTRVPGCMGLVCAFDTLIIETIAEPALPCKGFSDTA